MSVQLTAEERLRFLAGRVAEVMTERIHNEIPRSGDFQSISVSFQIPSTNNAGYMFVELSLTGTPEQRRLRIGVCRKGDDKLHSYYLLHDATERIAEYLQSDKIVKILIENFQALSNCVDNDD
ncbi:MAG: hypothetical protein ACI4V3_01665 [Faecousia sp.]